jgi:flavorubredoxin
MLKVLIANASKKNETRFISDFIAEGLRKSGVYINVLDIHDIKGINSLKGYDAIVFDSAIYIKDLLNKLVIDASKANKIDFRNKIGGAFGRPGCNDKAIDSLLHTMKNVLKMDMVNGPLIIDSISADSGGRKAKDFGQEIAHKLMN